MKLLVQIGSVISAAAWCFSLVAIFAGSATYSPAFVVGVTLATLGALGAAAWLCREAGE